MKAAWALVWQSFTVLHLWWVTKSGKRYDFRVTASAGGIALIAGVVLYILTT